MKKSYANNSVLFIDMKNSQRLLSIFALLLITTSTVSAWQTQSSEKDYSFPKTFTLTLELLGLPGRHLTDSTWEVSYHWRIGDEQSFEQLLRNEASSIELAKFGQLLKKRSFTRGNLSRQKNLKYTVSIPVKGELRKQLRDDVTRRQIIWLDVTVRIRDAKLGREVVKTINTTWGPSLYGNGNISVKMELTSSGILRWSTADPPPWIKPQSK